MPEADADKMAGKPERGRKVGGGTAEGMARTHQTGAACNEHAGEKTSPVFSV